MAGEEKKEELMPSMEYDPECDLLLKDAEECAGYKDAMFLWMFRAVVWMLRNHPKRIRMKPMKGIPEKEEEDG